VGREERRRDSSGGRIKVVIEAPYEGASFFVIFSSKISTFVLHIISHLRICKILQKSKAPGTEKCPNPIPF
jgi:hypothetical protein